MKVIIHNVNLHLFERFFFHRGNPLPGNTRNSSKDLFQVDPFEEESSPTWCPFWLLVHLWWCVRMDPFCNKPWYHCYLFLPRSQTSWTSRNSPCCLTVCLFTDYDKNYPILTCTNLKVLVSLYLYSYIVYLIISIYIQHTVLHQCPRSLTDLGEYIEVI